MEFTSTTSSLRCLTYPVGVEFFMLGVLVCLVSDASRVCNDSHPPSSGDSRVDIFHSGNLGLVLTNIPQVCWRCCHKVSCAMTVRSSKSWRAWTSVASLRGRLPVMPGSEEGFGPFVSGVSLSRSREVHPLRFERRMGSGPALWP